MKRIELAVLIGIVTAVLLASFTSFAQECSRIRGEVLRLHVLANSDSEEDQELKLAVRDAVLEGTGEIFTQAPGKAFVQETAQEHLELVRSIAQAVVDSRGYDYTVQVAIVNMYFETRTYQAATLPAGHYDALRITIGKGEGRNWWCVMFPPMCIPAASGQEGQELEAQIASLGQQPQYEPKFAVVELWESIADRFSGQERTLAEA